MTATVKSAIDALKRAAVGKGKVAKQLKDAVDHVASCLTLLNSSSLPFKSMEKLNAVLRKPMIPLYIAFPTQALHFSATVFTCIFSDKVSTALEIGNEEARMSWEVIQRSILSGVLDYIETNDSSQSKDIVGKALLSPICDICFPTSSVLPSPASSALRCTAYTLLCEIATSHSSNKQKLREPLILGGKRLGFIMSQSKDFLALESLLNLFAIILPSTNNSSSGRAKRTEFIQEVFDSPQRFTCGEEVIRVLESVATSDWEMTAMKIIDILAKSNITFPQPFRLDEFHACNTSFLLPNAVDRLYVDSKSFFANVDQGEVFETFEASYSQVRGIKLSASSDPGRSGATLVTIGLSSAPSVGDLTMTRPPHEQPITLVFHLLADDLERFLKSLHSRGLGDRLVHKKRRVSYAESPLDLDVDNLKVPQPSAEEKVKTVERIFSASSSEGHFYSDPLVETEVSLVELPEPISTDGSPLVTNSGSPDHGLSNHNTSSVKHPYDSSSPRALPVTVTGSDINTPPVILAPLVSKDTVALLNVSQGKGALDAVFEARNEALSKASGGSRPAIVHTFKESSQYTILGNGSSPKYNDRRSNVAPARVRAGRIIDSEDEDQVIIPEQRKTKSFRKRKAMASDIEDDIEDDIEAVTAIPSYAIERLSKENTIYTKSSAGPTHRIVTKRKVSLASVDLSSHAKASTTNILGHAGEDSILDNSAAVTGDFPPAFANASSIPVPAMPAEVPRLSSFGHDNTVADTVTHLDESTEAAYTIDAMACLSKSIEKSPSNPLDPPHFIATDLGNTGIRNAPLTVNEKTSDRSETPWALVKPENVVFTPKKKKVETVPNDPEDVPADGRPRKRPRVPFEDTKKTAPIARDASEVFGNCSTKTIRGTKQYGNGKKGRTSSPDPLTAVNYDEIPANVSSPSGNRHKISVASKGGRAAMKRTNGNTKGRPLAKAKGKTLAAQRKIPPPIDSVATNLAQAQPRRSGRITNAGVSTKSALKRSDSELIKPQATNAPVEPNRNSADRNKSYSPTSKTPQPLPTSVPGSHLGLNPQNQTKNISKTNQAPWEIAELPNRPTTLNNLTHSPIGIEEDTLVNFSPKVNELDHYIVKFEEYTEPIKGTSPSDSPARSSMPQYDVEMIDLTQDVSPVPVKISPEDIDVEGPQDMEPTDGNTTYAVKSDSPISLQRPMVPSPRLDTKSNRSHHSVTFAPFPVRPVTPIKRSHVVLPEPSRFVIRVPGPKTRKKLAISPLNVGPGHGLGSKGSPQYEDRMEYDFYRGDHNEDSLQAIVDVLNEINQVVIQNISRRFDAVRSDVRFGRDRLLHDAAVEVKKMYNESGHHFNALIDLEREYADVRRKIIGCFEDMHMVNQDVYQQIQGTIQEHDRTTLSKKFPGSLFSASLASIYQNVISL